MLNRPIGLLIALGLVLLLVWSRLGGGSTEVARTALIMGTLVEIKAVGGDEKDLEGAINDAFSAMRQVERQFSSHLPESEISRLNQTDAALEVSPPVFKLLQQGEEIRKASAGAFSMALGGVKKLWAIEEESPHIPTTEELAVILPPLNQPAVRFEGERVRRSSARVKLDLGGIAKGFAVDRALEILRGAGIVSASVNAGGDIGLIGGHGERAWRIGIQHPRRQGELLATIDIRDRAIVTSGDYERYFERDGVRYHHIFDPANGRPATACQSVSVLAPEAALADALATAVFVLGPKKGLQLLERFSNVGGVIVDSKGNIEATKEIKDHLLWR